MMRLRAQLFAMRCRVRDKNYPRRKQGRFKFIVDCD
jgi:hypothetical protein